MIRLDDAQGSKRELQSVLDQLRSNRSLEAQQKQVELKQEKARRQALKLARSYKQLRVNELEREKEVMHRSVLKNIATQEKNRETLLRFEKAESIRNGHRALQQSKFFNKNLKALSIQEDKQQQLETLADKLDLINQRIKELESTETNMLHRLQMSINRHNQSLRQSRFSSQEKPSPFLDAETRLN